LLNIELTPFMPSTTIWRNFAPRRCRGPRHCRTSAKSPRQIHRLALPSPSVSPTSDEARSPSLLNFAASNNVTSPRTSSQFDLPPSTHGRCSHRSRRPHPIAGLFMSAGRGPPLQACTEPRYRLPSNSLLEACYSVHVRGIAMRNEPTPSLQRSNRRRQQRRMVRSDAGNRELIGEIQILMWKDVGVSRT